MADVYLEYSDLEISKADVMASTDTDELTAWLNEQNEVSQELAIMLGAMKLAPQADTSRMARKLGFVNMSKAWIQKRLAELGVDDDRVHVRHVGNGTRVDGKINAMKAHLSQMEKNLQRRNETIKAQNIELTALRQKVQAYERAAAAEVANV